MKIADLVFDNVGCCGTHKWAEIKQDNGKITQVFDNGDGTYDVATHYGGMLFRGQQRYETAAEADARIAEDE